MRIVLRLIANDPTQQGSTAERMMNAGEGESQQWPNPACVR